MQYLAASDAKAAIHLLKQAHELLTGPSSLHDDELLAITLNNLGCYYQQTQDWLQSINYFRKALKLELNQTRIQIIMQNLSAVQRKVSSSQQTLKKTPGISHVIQQKTPKIGLRVCGKRKSRKSLSKCAAAARSMCSLYGVDQHKKLPRTTSQQKTTPKSIKPLEKLPEVVEPSKNQWARAALTSFWEKYEQLGGVQAHHSANS